MMIVQKDKGVLMDLIYCDKLWSGITDGLEAWNCDWKDRVDGLGQTAKVNKRRNCKNFSDGEIFEGIFKAVLSNATDWSKVEAVLPELYGCVHDFDVEWYSNLSDIDDIAMWFELRKAGAPYLRQNLKLLVNAAGKLSEQRRRHGSLDRYFGSMSDLVNGDAIAMARLIGDKSEHKLPGLGVPIAAEALKNIGYDVAKPDRHVNRAIGSFNLYKFKRWSDQSGTKAPVVTSKECVDVMRVVEDFASNLRLTSTFVDNAIWLLCAKSGAYYTNEKLRLIWDNN